MSQEILAKSGIMCQVLTINKHFVPELHLCGEKVLHGIPFNAGIKALEIQERGEVLFVVFCMVSVIHAAL